jgi:hypothetical protein
MALLDQTGTILVDDAGIMWRRPRSFGGGGLHGLEGLGELGFNWEGFGQAAAGIGGAVAGIIQAKKTGYAPQVEARFQVEESAQALKASAPQVASLCHLR